MLVQIEVTQEDIDNGIMEDADKCAVALACRRYFHQPLSVTGQELIWDPYPTDPSKEEIVISFLPPEVQKFTENFDENKKRVKPSVFEVDILEEYYHLIKEPELALNEEIDSENEILVTV